MPTVQRHKIVLPGDTVIAADMLASTLQEKPDFAAGAHPGPRTLQLGPGLLQVGDRIIATKAGTLFSMQDGKRWWVEGTQKRYTPAPGDNVIGQITAKFGEGYRVDIGGAHMAVLDGLAFAGATKRNKPQLAVGNLIYARVSLADKDIEPELECLNPTTGKADGYGELKGGFVFQATLGTCRRLLDPKTPVLDELGRRYAFEAAVGMNGRIWVNTASPQATVHVSLAIKQSEMLTPSQTREMVELISTSANLTMCAE